MKVVANAALQLTLMAALIAPAARASTPEIYSAVESSEGAAAVSLSTEPLSPPKPERVSRSKGSKKSKRPVSTSLPTRSRAELLAEAETQAKAQRRAEPKESVPSFDPVPAELTEALGHRLKLVETIVRRHARAYDYRTMTVRELEGVLTQLDAKSAPSEPIPAEASRSSEGKESALTEI